MITEFKNNLKYFCIKLETFSMFLISKINCLNIQNTQNKLFDWQEWNSVTTEHVYSGIKEYNISEFKIFTGTKRLISKILFTNIADKTGKTKCSIGIRI